MIATPTKEIDLLWFKHFNQFRLDVQIFEIETALGEAGYARALKLMEFVCATKPDLCGFAAEMELEPDRDAALRKIARHIGRPGHPLPQHELDKTLKVFRDAGFIELEETVLRIPVLRDLADEYSRRVVRRTEKRLHAKAEKPAADSEHVGTTP